jgi:hypothetical protein
MDVREGTLHSPAPGVKRKLPLLNHPNAVRLAVRDVEYAGGIDVDAVRPRECASKWIGFRTIAALPRATTFVTTPVASSMRAEIDRITGAFLQGTPFICQNWNTGFDAKGRPMPVPGSNSSAEGSFYVYPTAGGATNWQSPS